MDLHHQLPASKARALLIELQGYRDWSVRLNAMRDSARPKAKPNCVGCEAANLHQHLPGYEPDALTVKLQTNLKVVGYPGAAPGASWSQTK